LSSSKVLICYVIVRDTDRNFGDVSFFLIISNEHKYETFLCDLEKGDVLLHQPKVKMALGRKKFKGHCEIFPY
jgi:hypothetical protein